MKLLFIAFFASLATLSYGSIHGALVGPSGVVTAAGAIGPVGNSLAWGHGPWGWGGLGWAGHGGAAVVGPAAAPAVVAGPAGAIATSGVWGHGLGLGLGHGHWWRK
ncbi:uncharacterized PE-PGRS family protein PE_PGRS20-like [Coccinella septempunctata]|uniref:uncharacterized PE-PGRS family protein PE_PGRS20-like n=1 Tax=Coccinella septempunctata TaxID=41139 RepID=UPI001D07A750|nr:uncharacterized PE-PGRS family protein PE_PGRS20-like [Coccinella septempunctata]